MDNQERYAVIVARLEAEEKDHRTILANHAKLLDRIERIELAMAPLGELVPILDDFAATGRVGKMFAKLTIGIAGFLAAVAAIWFSITHGMSK